MTKIIELKSNFTFKKSKGYCKHSHVVVDEENRSVECSDCGNIVSAYDFIVMMARKEATDFIKFERLQKEIPKLEKRYSFLTKQVDRLVQLRRKMKTK